MNIADRDTLFKIAEDWELDFKGDLLEGAVEMYGSYENYLDILTNELMPIWIEEAEDNKDIYLEYKRKFSELNFENRRIRK